MFANPTLKSVKKIEGVFEEYDAVSPTFLEKHLGVGFYTVKAVVAHLLDEGKIREIKSSSKGIMYTKNG